MDYKPWEVVGGGGNVAYEEEKESSLFSRRVRDLSSLAFMEKETTTVNQSEPWRRERAKSVTRERERVMAGAKADVDVKTQSIRENKVTCRYTIGCI